MLLEGNGFLLSAIFRAFEAMKTRILCIVIRGRKEKPVCFFVFRLRTACFARTGDGASQVHIYEMHYELLMTTRYNRTRRVHIGLNKAFFISRKIYAPRHGAFFSGWNTLHRCNYRAVRSKIRPDANENSVRYFTAAHKLNYFVSRSLFWNYLNSFVFLL